MGQLLWDLDIYFKKKLRFWTKNVVGKRKNGPAGEASSRAKEIRQLFIHVHCTQIPLHTHNAPAGSRMNEPPLLNNHFSSKAARDYKISQKWKSYVIRNIVQG